MSDQNSTIEVSTSAAKAQLTSAIRSIIMGASGIVTALGYTHAAGALSEAALYAGPLATILVFLWSQISVRAKNRKLVAVAVNPSAVVLK